MKKSDNLSNKPTEVVITRSGSKCNQYLFGTLSRLYRCRYTRYPSFTDCCLSLLADAGLIPNSTAITEHGTTCSEPERKCRSSLCWSAFPRLIRRCIQDEKIACLKWGKSCAVSWTCVRLYLLSRLKDRIKYHVPSQPIQSSRRRLFRSEKKWLRLNPESSITRCLFRSLIRTCPSRCTILIAQNKRISEPLPERIISFANCNGIFSLSIRTQSTHIPIKNQVSL